MTSYSADHDAENLNLRRPLRGFPALIMLLQAVFLLLGPCGAIYDMVDAHRLDLILSVNPKQLVLYEKPRVLYRHGHPVV